MPAGGSQIAGTVAHKHQSASATGGPLDANSITEFSSTTTGSLIFFDGSSQATNLNAGNLNDVLTMGASLPAWSPVGGGVTLNKIENETSTDQSLTSSSFVTITAGQITTSNVSGKAVIQFSTYWQIDTGNMDVRFSMSTDGDTTPQRGSTHTHGNLKRHFYQGSVSETLGAQTIDVQIAIIAGGTANIAVDDESPTNFTILEIS